VLKAAGLLSFIKRYIRMGQNFHAIFRRTAVLSW